MRKRRAAAVATGTALLVVGVVVIRAVLGSTLPFEGSDTSSGSGAALESRIETQPALTAPVYDRTGAVLARPALVREEDGKLQLVIQRPFGRPLASVGVGRHLIVDVGMQGNLSDTVRSSFEGVRPFERPGQVVRLFVGDPLLTAPEMPPVTLTVDALLSESIYRVLTSADRGRGASAVVMNAKTGDLLAAVDEPGPDPDRDVQPVGRDSLFSMLAANLPASTMKVLTAAWILSNRPQDASAVHECDGDRCWMRHGRVNGLQDAVARSCDTWFRDEAANINAESWLRFLLSAGIAPDGIAGLPDSELTIANRRAGHLQWAHAVGQQVWVSLAGLATAYATVTSADGRLRPPSVIEKIGDESVVMAKGPEVVTPAVAAQLRSILRVTATAGTATTVNAAFKPKTASGKTGTGQVEGVTSDAVFVALAPWNDPEWIVVVSIRRGGSGSSAGRVAGQILNMLPFGDKAAATHGR